ncbi:MAG: serine/threonine-protein kinase, partial [Gemmatimonadota bacterium]
MTDLLGRVTRAVHDRYEVTRELGRGGMATVYLARDLRHGRQVAIKVFRPELATALGPDRFLREIRLAANLSHPNILSLFDSGESDGLLFYVMPFVEGESLASRLQREGQLPLDDALKITREVATALSHAHGKGIIHRDIKPDNILLGPTGALVADFGIAHAVEQSGEKRLTSTGFAIGTPAYMSPEQSVGAGRIDGRSDVYSLGCVLYEMLVGEPPFTGPSIQAVLARHSVERVPSLRTVRDTVPHAVEVAVHRSMAKSPADRFASADAFSAALAPERLHEVPTVPSLRAQRRRRTWWIGAAVLLLAIGVAAGILRPWARQAPGPVAVDAGMVAVLPFSVPGTGDSLATQLGTRVADLVADRLPGDGGPRAVFRQSVTAALDRIVGGSGGTLSESSALRTASAVGAGRLIIGSAADDGTRVTLGARMQEVPGGKLLAQVENISGPRDSLLALADRLTATLLVEGSGLPREHAEALLRLDLPVLRKYLAARAMYFRGRLGAALGLYREVLSADSTCYPAAFGLSITGANDDGLRLVGAQRSRLAPADLAYFNALSWPRIPGRSGFRDQIAGWDDAVDKAADRPEEWFQYGIALFSHGPLLGIGGVLDRAAAAFTRALELQPDFVFALGYLIELAALKQDTASVRRLGAQYFGLVPDGPLAQYYRWRIAVDLHQPDTLRTVRAGFDSLNPEALEAVINAAQLGGIGMDDAKSAAHALWSRSGLVDDSRFALFKQREIALNRGRPAEAADIFARQVASTQLRARDGLAAVVEAIYWGADTTIVTHWLSSATAEQLHGSRQDSLNTYFTTCGRGLWQVRQATTSALPATIARLRQANANESDPETAFIPLCADLLEAENAALLKHPDAFARLLTLDSLAASAPPAITWLQAAANLSAARLWEQQGKPDRALT